VREELVPGARVRDDEGVLGAERREGVREDRHAERAVDADELPPAPRAGSRAGRRG
jgi:hypothetical protein